MIHEKSFKEDTLKQDHECPPPTFMNIHHYDKMPSDAFDLSDLYEIGKTRLKFLQKLDKRYFPDF